MTAKAFIARALTIVAALGCVGAARAQPQPVRLSMGYDGRLYLKVLDVTVEQTIDAAAFAASAHIRTSGLLALFRKIDLRAEGQGHISGGVVTPHLFSYLNTDGHKNRHVSATWSGGDVATESKPQFPSMGDPPASREQKLEAADPLTVLTRMTLLPPGEKPCQGVGQFFDGKQRYDLEYGFKGATQPDERERRLGLVNTLRCSVTYHEVAGFKKKPPDQRNQGLRRDVTLGLGRVGPNGPWVVSYLRAETFMGAAQVNLERLVVSPERP